MNAFPLRNLSNLLNKRSIIDATSQYFVSRNVTLVSEISSLHELRFLCIANVDVICCKNDGSAHKHIDIKVFTVNQHANNRDGW